MKEKSRSWPTVGSDGRVDDVVETEDDDKGRRLAKVVGVGTVLILVLILGVIAFVAFVLIGSVTQTVTKGQYCTTLNEMYSYLSAHSALAEKGPIPKNIEAFDRANVAYLQHLSDHPPDSSPADLRSAVHDFLAFFQAGVNGDAGLSEQRFVSDGNVIATWRMANCRTAESLSR